MKLKLISLFSILFLCTAIASAQGTDCGKGNDGQNNGKGSPSCGNKSGNGGNSGGTGGNGGNGGQGGNGGNGGNSNVVVTNENLNQIKLSSSSNSLSTSKSNSSSQSNSTSTATGGNATATGGNASANQTQTANGGNATNAGNTQTTEFNQVHQTASAIAPDAYPTAPCRVAGSGAGSSPFFGVSFSGSKLDTECEKRETARSFALLGERLAALEVLCQTKAAKETKPTICATIK